MNVSPETPVFIIGYMACGKTTFGRALAAPWTGNSSTSISTSSSGSGSVSATFFSRKGRMNSAGWKRPCSARRVEFSNVVVACGGGTPCHASNMDYMLGRGLTVWLQASEERTVARLTANNARRPLMAGKARTRSAPQCAEGLAARLPHYERAHIIFSGEELEDRRQISRTVSAFLSLP